MEFCPHILIHTLIAGLYFPLIAAGIEVLYVLSRIVYAVGYSIHPKFRVFGVILGNLLVLIELGLAIASVVLRFNATLIPIILLLILLFISAFSGSFLYRPKMFNKDFMAQFEAEHKDAFGEKSSLPPAGFPDAGHGRYSNKVDYKDWMKLNIWVRIHQNLMEFIYFYVLCLMIIGIHWQWVGFGLGMVFFFLRIGYSLGYFVKPARRAISGIPMVAFNFISFVAVWCIIDMYFGITK